MKHILLSVLIPSLYNRASMLIALLREIENQIKENHADGSIELLVEADSGELSIGGKRNLLLQKAKGDYCVFIDDDDFISDAYIKELLNGIRSGADCCSLTGEITTNGASAKLFRHFISCDKYDEVNGEYVRYPNHLNCIKTAIAKQFKFPEKNFSEDTEWATMLHKSGLLKTEHTIGSVIYHYRYVSNKT